MKIRLLAIALLLAGCATRPDYPPGVEAPSEAEATQAVRDALSLAALRAIQRAGRLDGYYADRRIRIAIAAGAESVDSRLRNLDLDMYLDRSIQQLNRVAEETAPAARQLFLEAIAALDIDAPFDLVDADEDAGTRALMAQAYDDIVAQYRPLVSDVLDQSSTRAYHAKIIDRYNSLPFSFNIGDDLDGYLAQAAIDGLFVLMAEEEARIRRIPAARGTREIDRVFGILR